MTNVRTPLQSIMAGIAFVIVSFILIWDTDIIIVIGVLFAILGTMMLTTGVLTLIGNSQRSEPRRIIDLKKEDFTDIFGVRK